MKEKFIAELTNLSISVAENRKSYTNLAESLFSTRSTKVNKKSKNDWTTLHFENLSKDLLFDFSKERIDYLLEVKTYLQQTLSQGEQAVKNREILLKSANADFILDSTLLDYLKANEFSQARSYLMLMLNNQQLTLEELFQSIYYVHQHYPTLFEEEVESAFVQAMDNNEANWDSDYFHLQQVYLNRNFSLARLLHLANIREILMKKGHCEFQSTKAQKTKTTAETKQPSFSRAETKMERRDPFLEASNRQNHFMKILYLVGGAVLGLAALIWAVKK